MTSGKPELRRQMRRLRARLAAELPMAAAEAANHLPAALIASTRIVAGYRPIGSEMDPGPALARFMAAGAQIALPAVVSPDRPMEFRLWSQGDPLAPDALGVAAPTRLRGLARPDVVIAPVLAFDAHGGRLGQGGGCFDRTLAELRANGPLIVIGLAFAGQEVEAVPREPHDQGLDATLTESGYRWVRKDP
ncbi:MAG: 5-formyltetrahydrofolate cyclo-ligase [Caulobacteraceae bacterium]|jgi:5-formyltetrahydrofolate cyclo-ligase